MSAKRKLPHYMCKLCDMIISSKVKHLENHGFNANAICNYEIEVGPKRFEKFMSKYLEQTDRELSSYTLTTRQYEKTMGSLTQIG